MEAGAVGAVAVAKEGRLRLPLEGRHLSSPIRIGDGRHHLRLKFMCMQLKKNGV
jgi:hypothetical protein